MGGGEGINIARGRLQADFRAVVTSREGDRVGAGLAVSVTVFKEKAYLKQINVHIC